MSFKITKEKLLNDLNKIKDLVELPSLYLSNYFSELKNDVDKDFASKQLKLQNDDCKKKNLNALWQEMIEKIESFEKNCIETSYDLETHKTRINEIETMLTNAELINLDEIEEMIENEEINLLEILFKKKTILFSKNKELLIILNDEFISKASLKKDFENFVLDNQMVKIKIMKKQAPLIRENICEFSLELNKKLNLGNFRQIREIKENSFYGLNNLQSLSFYKNEITEIKENLFKGLNNLQDLNLNFNRITEIKEDSFNGLKNLQRLYLNYNQITEIRENSFNKLNNLQKLCLGGNRITEIKENSFNGLSNLQQLYLYGNQITKIERNSFNGLNNLKELDLTDNKMANLSKSFLKIKYLFTPTRLLIFS